MEYIYEERNILSKTFCRELIEKFESDSRKYEGMIGTGRVDNTVKTCTDLSLEECTGWNLEIKRLNDAFHTAFENYQNNLKLNVFGEDKAHILEKVFPYPNVNRTPFLMGRYGVDGHFLWHIDHINDRNGERICNFIIYLNDHEACTEFVDGKKIKPEAGKIAFFPSTWTYGHCAKPVEEGNKYIITCFVFHGKLPKFILPKEGLPKESLPKESLPKQSLPFIISHN